MAIGCAHLQEANHLLRDAGHPPVSPVLEQEIEQALKEYRPACTLEHLKVHTHPYTFLGVATRSCKTPCDHISSLYKGNTSSHPS